MSAVLYPSITLGQTTDISSLPQELYDKIKFPNTVHGKKKQLCVVYTSHDSKKIHLLQEIVFRQNSLTKERLYDKRSNTQYYSKTD